MQELFNDPEMADGYTRARPALHSLIAERIEAYLGSGRRVRRALDIGCGTGLSTAVLSSFARQAVGVEPAFNMVKNAGDLALGGDFAQGRAEQLPFASGSMELMSAAGSLNWIELESFFPEANRVLRAGGQLIVYDFEPGRQFPDSEILFKWFVEFEKRFPPPVCREISPSTLALDSGPLTMSDHESFCLSLTMTHGAYLEYIMSETNIVEAVKRGSLREDIWDWCSESLAAVFRDQEQTILFNCFIAYLSRES